MSYKLVLVLFLALGLGMVNDVGAVVRYVPGTHDTIQAALIAAQRGDVISLQANFEILPGEYMYVYGETQYALRVNKILTLELNGYWITSEADVTLYVAGTGNLTLWDSSEAHNGQVINPIGDAVSNLGTLTIHSGNINGGTHGLLNSYSSGLLYGTTRINGGVFSGLTAVGNYGLMTITGGTFNGTQHYDIDNSGKLTLTNDIILNKFRLCDGSNAADLEGKGTLILNPGVDIFGSTTASNLYVMPGATLNIPAGNTLGLASGVVTEVFDLHWSPTSGLWQSKVANLTRRLNFNRIQDAIDADATQAGDVLEVAPGTHAQVPSGSPSHGVIMNKGVTLRSSGGALATTIDAGGAYMGLCIPANAGTVTIEGFTVSNFTHLGIAQSWTASAGTVSIVKDNRIVATNGLLRNGIQVSGNGSQVTGNTVVGASYSTEDPTYGSSAILDVNGSNVLIQGNTVGGADYGITVQNFDYYSTGQTVGSVTVDDNIVSGCLQTGILVSGQDETANDALSTISINSNEVGGNPEGIATAGCSITNLAVTGNDMEDNTIHIVNRQPAPINIQALLPETNVFDRYFVVDQAIYGTASILYVDAPDSLMHGNEGQTYSVRVSHVIGLNGFSLLIRIPNDDFFEPGSFALGQAFATLDPPAALTPVVIEAGENYYDVRVDCSSASNVSVQGDNLELLTFHLTCKPEASAPEGSLIELPRLKWGCSMIKRNPFPARQPSES